MKRGPINKGEILRLRVNGFKNPYFSRPIDGFKIRTLDNDGGMIDETPEFSINAQAPATISEAVIRLVPNSESSSNKVLEKSELLLDFKIPLPLETGCIISVQLPTEFT